jgi:hypothetical protein
VRRPADRLDPPHLHRRLGVRGLRRREPAVLSARELQRRLGLSDDELLRILDADPLSLIGGDLDHRPELPILLALIDGHEPSLLQIWVRNGPIDLLLARQFGAFEDALDALDRLG